MSLLFKRDITATASDLIPGRAAWNPGTSVTPESALGHSGVWAALRLRADLISMLPVDVYRRSGGIAVALPSSPFLVDPAGDGTGVAAWLYATQFDLDRYGNCYGIIRARDGYGLPARVELVPASRVTVMVTDGKLSSYRVGSDMYAPSEVWHERQYVIAGSPVGLSPIAYAQMSVSGYLSAQKFAADWFNAGASPKGTLKNVNKTLSADEAAVMKERFKAATANQDIFVTGSDWEYSMEAAAASQSTFLDEMQYGVTDVARWFSVPADVIDGLAPTGNITYANIVQRNLQLLILNLQSPINRREFALSKATPSPRFVKLNSDALLRMDPKSVTENLAAQVAARLRTPDEGREKLDLAPLTDSQYAQFDRLWPAKAQTPTAKEA